MKLTKKRRQRDPHVCSPNDAERADFPQFAEITGWPVKPRASLETPAVFLLDQPCQPGR